MRSILVAVLLAGTVAAPAFAQDSSPAPYTGFRIEGLAGWDRVQNNGHDDGVNYGVAAGYDMQAGGAIVGIEGEVADSSTKQCSGAKTTVDPRLCAKAARDLYIGGRIGAPVGKALVYAKAGYTNTRAKLTSDDGTSRVTLAKTDLDGVRVGAGVEYPVGQRAYVKTEYRYSNYQDGFTRHQVVGGFGLRF